MASALVERELNYIVVSNHIKEISNSSLTSDFATFTKTYFFDLLNDIRRCFLYAEKQRKGQNF